MDQVDLLRLVTETLERLNITYAVVGSYASGAWGEPRMTLDIDIVAAITQSDVDLLCKAFDSEDFYLSRSAMLEAIEHQTQFNLVHPASANKVDFMTPGNTQWAQQQLSRALDAPLLNDCSVKVATPEDVILGKLLYFQEGGSEKHVRDITGILTTEAVELDTDYLERWCKQLGVLGEWDSILAKLGG